MVTEKEQDQNRLWTILAYGVVPATGGEWLQSGWLYKPDAGWRRLCGIVVRSISTGEEIEIRTPEEYEAFIAREVPDA